MVVVKNGRGLLGLGALKSVLFQERIDGMGWFFGLWYKFRKAKSYFNNYCVGMFKNGRGLMDHGTLKSGVSHKWFDELCRSTEWFLHADSDQTIFGLMTNLYLWHLNVGGPLLLYFARVFRKTSLWAKVTPK